MLLRFENNFEDFDLEICESSNLEICEDFDFEKEYNILQTNFLDNSKTLFRILLLTSRDCNIKIKLQKSSI